MALSDLPNAKWDLAGDQPICKEDFKFIESAILETGGGGVGSDLPIIRVDAGTVKIAASADSPASTFFNGFPNVLNFGENLDFNLTDKKQRSVTADVTCAMAIADNLFGNEISSQLYALFAIADDIDTDFVLKAMPFVTVKEDAGQVIKCGTHTTPATGVDYGFTKDEFIYGKIYVLSGSSRGEARTITANSDDGAGATTITYSGADMGLSAGDSLIILPYGGNSSSISGANFVYLGCFYNGAGGDIYDSQANRKSAIFMNAGTYHWIVLASVLTVQLVMRGAGGGGGGADGATGANGDLGICAIPIVPGEIVKVVVGSGGAGGVTGGPGIVGQDTTFTCADGTTTVHGGAPGLANGSPGVGLGYVHSDGSGDGGAGSSAGGSAGHDGCVNMAW